MEKIDFYGNYVWKNSLEVVTTIYTAFCGIKK